MSDFYSTSTTDFVNQTLPFTIGVVFMVGSFVVLCLYSHRALGIVFGFLVRWLVLPFIDLPSDSADPKDRSQIKPHFSIDAIQFAPMRCRLLFKGVRYQSPSVAVKVLDGFITFRFWGPGALWNVRKGVGLFGNNSKWSNEWVCVKDAVEGAATDIADTPTQRKAPTHGKSKVAAGDGGWFLSKWWRQRRAQADDEDVDEELAVRQPSDVLGGAAESASSTLRRTTSSSSSTHRDAQQQPPSTPALTYFSTNSGSSPVTPGGGVTHGTPPTAEQVSPTISNSPLQPPSASQQRKQQRRRTNPALGSIMITEALIGTPCRVRVGDTANPSVWTAPEDAAINEPHPSVRGGYLRSLWGQPDRPERGGPTAPGAATSSSPRMRGLMEDRLEEACRTDTYEAAERYKSFTLPLLGWRVPVSVSALYPQRKKVQSVDRAGGRTRVRNRRGGGIAAESGISPYSPYSPMSDDGALGSGASFADFPATPDLFSRGHQRSSSIFGAQSDVDGEALRGEEDELLERLEEAKAARAWEAFCSCNQVCIVGVHTGTKAAAPLDPANTASVSIAREDDVDSTPLAAASSITNPLLVVRVPLAVLKQYYGTYQTALYRFHERGVVAVAGSAAGASKYRTGSTTAAAPASTKNPPRASRSSAFYQRSSSDRGAFSAQEILNAFGDRDEEETGKYVDLWVRPEDVMIPRRAGLVEVCLNGLTVNLMGSTGRYDELAKRLSEAGKAGGDGGGQHGGAGNAIMSTLWSYLSRSSEGGDRASAKNPYSSPIESHQLDQLPAAPPVAPLSNGQPPYFISGLLRALGPIEMRVFVGRLALGAVPPKDVLEQLGKSATNNNSNNPQSGAEADKRPHPPPLSSPAATSLRTPGDSLLSSQQEEDLLPPLPIHPYSLQCAFETLEGCFFRTQRDVNPLDHHRDVVDVTLTKVTMQWHRTALNLTAAGTTRPLVGQKLTKRGGRGGGKKKREGFFRWVANGLRRGKAGKKKRGNTNGKGPRGPERNHPHNSPSFEIGERKASGESGADGGGDVVLADPADAASITDRHGDASTAQPSQSSSSSTSSLSHSIGDNDVGSRDNEIAGDESEWSTDEEGFTNSSDSELGGTSMLEAPDDEEEGALQQQVRKWRRGARLLLRGEAEHQASPRRYSGDHKSGHPSRNRRRPRRYSHNGQRGTWSSTTGNNGSFGRASPSKAAADGDGLPVEEMFGVVLDGGSDALLRVRYFWDGCGAVPGPRWWSEELLRQQADPSTANTTSADSDIQLEARRLKTEFAILQRLHPELIDCMQMLPKMGVEIFVDTDELAYGSWVEYGRSALTRHFFPPTFDPTRDYSAVVYPSCLYLGKEDHAEEASAVVADLLSVRGRHHRPRNHNGVDLDAIEMDGIPQTGGGGPPQLRRAQRLKKSLLKRVRKEAQLQHQRPIGSFSFTLQFNRAGGTRVVMPFRAKDPQSALPHSIRPLETPYRNGGGPRALLLTVGQGSGVHIDAPTGFIVPPWDAVRSMPSLAPISTTSANKQATTPPTPSANKNAKRRHHHNYNQSSSSPGRRGSTATNNAPAVGSSPSPPVGESAKVRAALAHEQRLQRLRCTTTRTTVTLLAPQVFTTVVGGAKLLEARRCDLQVALTAGEFWNMEQHLHTTARAQCAQVWWIADQLPLLQDFIADWGNVARMYHPSEVHHVDRRHFAEFYSSFFVPAVHTYDISFTGIAAPSAPPAAPLGDPADPKLAHFLFSMGMGPEPEAVGLGDGDTSSGSRPPHRGNSFRKSGQQDGEASGAHRQPPAWTHPVFALSLTVSGNTDNVVKTSPTTNTSMVIASPTVSVQLRVPFNVPRLRRRNYTTIDYDVLLGNVRCFFDVPASHEWASKGFTGGKWDSEGAAALSALLQEVASTTGHPRRSPSPRSHHDDAARAGHLPPPPPVWCRDVPCGRAEDLRVHGNYTMESGPQPSYRVRLEERHRRRGSLFGGAHLSSSARDQSAPSLGTSKNVTSPESGGPATTAPTDLGGSQLSSHTHSNSGGHSRMASDHSTGQPQYKPQRQTSSTVQQQPPPTPSWTAPPLTFPRASIKRVQVPSRPQAGDRPLADVHAAASAPSHAAPSASHAQPFRDFAEVNIDITKLNATVTPALGITIVRILKNLFMEASGSVEPCDLFGISDLLRARGEVSGEVNFKAALDQFLKKGAGNGDNATSLRGSPPMFGIETQLAINFNLPNLVVSAGYDPVANAHVVPLSRVQLMHPVALLLVEQYSATPNQMGTHHHRHHRNTNNNPTKSSTSWAVDALVRRNGSEALLSQNPIRNYSVSCIDARTGLPASAVPFIGVTGSEGTLVCNIQPGKSNIQLTTAPLTVSLPAVAPTMERLVSAAVTLNSKTHHHHVPGGPAADLSSFSSSSRFTSTSFPALPTLSHRAAIVQRYSPDAFLCIGAVTFGRSRQNGFAPVAVSYAGTTSLTIPEGISGSFDSLTTYLPPLALLAVSAKFQATEAVDVEIRNAISKALDAATTKDFNPSSQPTFREDVERVIRQSGVDSVVFPPKSSSRGVDGGARALFQEKLRMLEETVIGRTENVQRATLGSEEGKPPTEASTRPRPTNLTLSLINDMLEALGRTRRSPEMMLASRHPAWRATAIGQFLHSHRFANEVSRRRFAREVHEKIVQDRMADSFALLSTRVSIGPTTLRLRFDTPSEANTPARGTSHRHHHHAPSSFLLLELLSGVHLAALGLHEEPVSARQTLVVENINVRSLLPRSCLGLSDTTLSTTPVGMGGGGEPASTSSSTLPRLGSRRGGWGSVTNRGPPDAPYVEVGLMRTGVFARRFLSIPEAPGKGDKQLRFLSRFKYQHPIVAQRDGGEGSMVAAEDTLDGGIGSPLFVGMSMANPNAVGSVRPSRERAPPFDADRLLSSTFSTQHTRFLSQNAMSTSTALHGATPNSVGGGNNGKLGSVNFNDTLRFGATLNPALLSATTNTLTPQARTALHGRLLSLPTFVQERLVRLLEKGTSAPSSFGEEYSASSTSASPLLPKRGDERRPFFSAIPDNIEDLGAHNNRSLHRRRNSLQSGSLPSEEGGTAASSARHRSAEATTARFLAALQSGVGDARGDSTQRGTSSESSVVERSQRPVSSSGPPPIGVVTARNSEVYDGPLLQVTESAFFRDDFGGEDDEGSSTGDLSSFGSDPRDATLAGEEAVADGGAPRSVPSHGEATTTSFPEGGLSGSALTSTLPSGRISVVLDQQPPPQGENSPPAASTANDTTNRQLFETQSESGVFGSVHSRTPSDEDQDNATATNPGRRRNSGALSRDASLDHLTDTAALRTCMSGGTSNLDRIDDEDGFSTAEATDSSDWTVSSEQPTVGGHPSTDPLRVGRQRFSGHVTSSDGSVNSANSSPVARNDTFVGNAAEGSGGGGAAHRTPSTHSSSTYQNKNVAKGVDPNPSDDDNLFSSRSSLVADVEPQYAFHFDAQHEANKAARKVAAAQQADISAATTIGGGGLLLDATAMTGTNEEEDGSLLQATISRPFQSSGGAHRRKSGGGASSADRRSPSPVPPGINEEAAKGLQERKERLAAKLLDLILSNAPQTLPGSLRDAYFSSLPLWRAQLPPTPLHFDPHLHVQSYDMESVCEANGGPVAGLYSQAGFNGDLLASTSAAGGYPLRESGGDTLGVGGMASTSSRGTGRQLLDALDRTKVDVRSFGPDRYAIDIDGLAVPDGVTGRFAGLPDVGVRPLPTSLTATQHPSLQVLQQQRLFATDPPLTPSFGLGSFAAPPPSNSPNESTSAPPNMFDTTASLLQQQPSPTLPDEDAMRAKTTAAAVLDLIDWLEGRRLEDKTQLPSEKGKPVPPPNSPASDTGDLAAAAAADVLTAADDLWAFSEAVAGRGQRAARFDMESAYADIDLARSDHTAAGDRNLSWVPAAKGAPWNGGGAASPSSTQQAPPPPCSHMHLHITHTYISVSKESVLLLNASLSECLGVKALVEGFTDCIADTGDPHRQQSSATFSVSHTRVASSVSVATPNTSMTLASAKHALPPPGSIAAGPPLGAPALVSDSIVSLRIPRCVVVLSVLQRDQLTPIRATSPPSTSVPGALPSPAASAVGAVTTLYTLTSIVKDVNAVLQTSNPGTRLMAGSKTSTSKQLLQELRKRSWSVRSGLIAVVLNKVLDEGGLMRIRTAFQCVGDELRSREAARNAEQAAERDRRRRKKTKGRSSADSSKQSNDQRHEVGQKNNNALPTAEGATPLYTHPSSRGCTESLQVSIPKGTTREFPHLSNRQLMVLFATDGVLRGRYESKGNAFGSAVTAAFDKCAAHVTSPALPCLAGLKQHLQPTASGSPAAPASREVAGGASPPPSALEGIVMTLLTPTDSQRAQGVVRGNSITLSLWTSRTANERHRFHRSPSGVPSTSPSAPAPQSHANPLLAAVGSAHTDGDMMRLAMLLQSYHPAIRFLGRKSNKPGGGPSEGGASSRLRKGLKFPDLAGAANMSNAVRHFYQHQQQQQLAALQRERALATAAPTTVFVTGDLSDCKLFVWPTVAVFVESLVEASQRQRSVFPPAAPAPTTQLAAGAQAPNNVSVGSSSTADKGGRRRPPAVALPAGASPLLEATSASFLSDTLMSNTSDVGAVAPLPPLPPPALSLSPTSGAGPTSKPHHLLTVDSAFALRRVTLHFLVDTSNYVRLTTNKLTASGTYRHRSGNNVVGVNYIDTQSATETPTSTYYQSTTTTPPLSPQPQFHANGSATADDCRVVGPSSLKGSCGVFFDTFELDYCGDLSMLRVGGSASRPASPIRDASVLSPIEPHTQERVNGLSHRGVDGAVDAIPNNGDLRHEGTGTDSHLAESFLGAATVNSKLFQSTVRLGHSDKSDTGPIGDTANSPFARSSPPFPNQRRRTSQYVPSEDEDADDSLSRSQSPEARSESPTVACGAEEDTFSPCIAHPTSLRGDRVAYFSINKFQVSVQAAPVFNSHTTADSASVTTSEPVSADGTQINTFVHVGSAGVKAPFRPYLLEAMGPQVERFGSEWRRAINLLLHGSDSSVAVKSATGSNPPIPSTTATDKDATNATLGQDQPPDMHQQATKLLRAVVVSVSLNDLYVVAGLPKRAEVLFRVPKVTLVHTASLVSSQSSTKLRVTASQVASVGRDDRRRELSLPEVYVTILRTHGACTAAVSTDDIPHHHRRSSSTSADRRNSTTTPPIPTSTPRESPVRSDKGMHTDVSILVGHFAATLSPEFVAHIFIFYDLLMHEVLVMLKEKALSPPPQPQSPPTPAKRSLKRAPTSHKASSAADRPPPTSSLSVAAIAKGCRVSYLSSVAVTTLSVRGVTVEHQHYARALPDDDRTRGESSLTHPPSKGVLYTGGPATLVRLDRRRRSSSLPQQPPSKIPIHSTSVQVAEIHGVIADRYDYDLREHYRAQAASMKPQPGAPKHQREKGSAPPTSSPTPTSASGAAFPLTSRPQPAATVPPAHNDDVPAASTVFDLVDRELPVGCGYVWGSFRTSVSLSNRLDVVPSSSPNLKGGGGDSGEGLVVSTPNGSSDTNFSLLSRSLAPGSVPVEVLSSIKNSAREFRRSSGKGRPKEDEGRRRRSLWTKSSSWSADVPKVDVLGRMGLYAHVLMIQRQLQSVLKRHQISARRLERTRKLVTGSPEFKAMLLRVGDRSVINASATKHTQQASRSGEGVALSSSSALPVRNSGGIDGGFLPSNLQARRGSLNLRLGDSFADEVGVGRSGDPRGSSSSAPAVLPATKSSIRRQQDAKGEGDARGTEKKRAVFVAFDEPPSTSGPNRQGRRQKETSAHPSTSSSTQDSSSTPDTDTEESTMASTSGSGVDHPISTNSLPAVAGVLTLSVRSVCVVMPFGNAVYNRLVTGEAQPATPTTATTAATSSSNPNAGKAHRQPSPPERGTSKRRSEHGSNTVPLSSDSSSDDSGPTSPHYSTTASEDVSSAGSQSSPHRNGSRGDRHRSPVISADARLHRRYSKQGIVGSGTSLEAGIPAALVPDRLILADLPPRHTLTPVYAAKLVVKSINGSICRDLLFSAALLDGKGWQGPSDGDVELGSEEDWNREGPSSPSSAAALLYSNSHQFHDPYSDTSRSSLAVDGFNDEDSFERLLLQQASRKHTGHLEITSVLIYITNGTKLSSVNSQLLFNLIASRAVLGGQGVLHYDPTHVTSYAHAPSTAGGAANSSIASGSRPPPPPTTSSQHSQRSSSISSATPAAEEPPATLYSSLLAEFNCSSTKVSIPAITCPFRIDVDEHLNSQSAKIRLRCDAPHCNLSTQLVGFVEEAAKEVTRLTLPDALITVPSSSSPPSNNGIASAAPTDPFDRNADTIRTDTTLDENSPVSKGKAPATVPGTPSIPPPTKSTRSLHVTVVMEPGVVEVSSIQAAPRKVPGRASSTTPTSAQRPPLTPFTGSSPQSQRRGTGDGGVGAFVEVALMTLPFPGLNGQLLFERQSHSYDYKSPLRASDAMYSSPTERQMCGSSHSQSVAASLGFSWGTRRVTLRAPTGSVVAELDHWRREFVLMRERAIHLVRVVDILENGAKKHHSEVMGLIPHTTLQEVLIPIPRCFAEHASVVHAIRRTHINKQQQQTPTAVPAVMLTPIDGMQFSTSSSRGSAQQYDPSAFAYRFHRVPKEALEPPKSTETSRSGPPTLPEDPASTGSKYDTDLRLAVFVEPVCWMYGAQPVSTAFLSFDCGTMSSLITATLPGVRPRRDDGIDIATGDSEATHQGGSATRGRCLSAVVSVKEVSLICGAPMEPQSLNCMLAGLHASVVADDAGKVAVVIKAYEPATSDPTAPRPTPHPMQEQRGDFPDNSGEMRDGRPRGDRGGSPSPAMPPLTPTAASPFSLPGSEWAASSRNSAAVGRVPQGLFARASVRLGHMRQLYEVLQLWVLRTEEYHTALRRGVLDQGRAAARAALRSNNAVPQVATAPHQRHRHRDPTGHTKVSKGSTSKEKRVTILADSPGAIRPVARSGPEQEEPSANAGAAETKDGEVQYSSAEIASKKIKKRQPLRNITFVFNSVMSSAVVLDFGAGNRHSVSVGVVAIKYNRLDLDTLHEALLRGPSNGPSAPYNGSPFLPPPTPIVGILSSKSRYGTTEGQGDEGRTKKTKPQQQGSAHHQPLPATQPSANSASSLDLRNSMEDLSFVLQDLFVHSEGTLTGITNIPQGLRVRFTKIRQPSHSDKNQHLFSHASSPDAAEIDENALSTTDLLELSTEGTHVNAARALASARLSTPQGRTQVLSVQLPAFACYLKERDAKDICLVEAVNVSFLIRDLLSPPERTSNPADQYLNNQRRSTEVSLMSDALTAGLAADAQDKLLISKGVATSELHRQQSSATRASLAVDVNVPREAIEVYLTAVDAAGTSSHPLSESSSSSAQFTMPHAQSSSAAASSPHNPPSLQKPSTSTVGYFPLLPTSVIRVVFPLSVAGGENADDVAIGGRRNASVVSRGGGAASVVSDLSETTSKRKVANDGGGGGQLRPAVEISVRLGDVVLQLGRLIPKRHTLFQHRASSASAVWAASRGLRSTPTGGGDMDGLGTTADASRGEAGAFTFSMGSYLQAIAPATSSGLVTAGIVITIPACSVLYAQSPADGGSVMKYLLEVTASQWDLSRTGARKMILGCRGANTVQLFFEQPTRSLRVGYAFEFTQDLPWRGVPEFDDLAAISATVQQFRDHLKRQSQDKAAAAHAQQHRFNPASRPSAIAIPTTPGSARGSGSARDDELLETRRSMRSGGGADSRPQQDGDQHPPQDRRAFREMRPSLFAPTISDAHFSVDRLLAAAGLSTNTVPLFVIKQLCDPLASLSDRVGALLEQ